MKNIFFLSGILFCFSFSSIQKSDFFGNWNVADSYNIESLSLKQVAINDIVRQKIVEQKTQIIFTKDSIKMKENNMIIEKSKIKNLKKITKDSLIFSFDDHIGSFKLKNESSGVLILDNKAVFKLNRK